MSAEKAPHIGTLAEKSLHAGLKDWYGRPGDQFEVRVDGFVIDIVREDVLVEIQTRHLYAMKRKLRRLLADHSVHLIHPIPSEKWIVREDAQGVFVQRRKSPKHGKILNIFDELVRIPHLLSHPNLTLEVVLTQQEEIWRDDGKGSWRRRHWSIADQHLLSVVEQAIFETPHDYMAVIPADLQRPFTNRQLADKLKCPVKLAQKITYTLRKMDMLEIVGKQGNALQFQPLHELSYN